MNKQAIDNIKNRLKEIKDGNKAEENKTINLIHEIVLEDIGSLIINNSPLLLPNSGAVVLCKDFQFSYYTPPATIVGLDFSENERLIIYIDEDSCKLLIKLLDRVDRKFCGFSFGKKYLTKFSYALHRCDIKKFAQELLLNLAEIAQNNLCENRLANEEPDNIRQLNEIKNRLNRLMENE